MGEFFCSSPPDCQICLQEKKKGCSTAIFVRTVIQEAPHEGVFFFRGQLTSQQPLAGHRCKLSLSGFRKFCVHHLCRSRWEIDTFMHISGDTGDFFSRAALECSLSKHGVFNKCISFAYFISYSNDKNQVLFYI